MSMAQKNRCRRLDCTILQGAVRQYHDEISTWVFSYSTNNTTAPPALGNHIPCARTYFSYDVCSSLLHKIPICCPGPVSERVLNVRLNVIVAAVQCPGDQLVAELQQVYTRLAASSGEIIERVEVDERYYLADDARCWCQYHAVTCGAEALTDNILRLPS